MRARRRRATSWGSSCVATASRPGLASPTALSMPPRNSATRGAGWPRRGSGVTALVTTPPSASRSITPATSRPNPAVPAARSTGFWKVVPRRAMSLTGGPPAAPVGAGAPRAGGDARRVPAADRGPARAGGAAGARRPALLPRRGRRARVPASAPASLPPPRTPGSSRRAGRGCTGTSGRRRRAPAAASRRRPDRAPGRRRWPWGRTATRAARGRNSGTAPPRGAGRRASRAPAPRRGGGRLRYRPPPRPPAAAALERDGRGLRTDGRGQRVEHGEPGGFIGAAFEPAAHEPRHLRRAAPGDQRLRLDGPGRGLLGAREDRSRALGISPRQGGESREVRGARAASPVGRGEHRLEQAQPQSSFAGSQRAFRTGEGGALAQRRLGHRGEGLLERFERIGARSAAGPPLPFQHQGVVRPAAARVVHTQRLGLDGGPRPGEPRLGRLAARLMLLALTGEAPGAPHPIVIDARPRRG